MSLIGWNTQISRLYVKDYAADMSGGIAMYEEEVSKLQRIIDDSGNIVFLGRRRIHGEQYPGFSQCGRALPAAV